MTVKAVNDPRNRRDEWRQTFTKPLFCTRCGYELEERKVLGLFDTHSGKREKLTVFDCPNFSVNIRHDRWWTDFRFPQLPVSDPRLLNE